MTLIRVCWEVGLEMALEEDSHEETMGRCRLQDMGKKELSLTRI